MVKPHFHSIKGDRVAQIVLEKIREENCVKVEALDVTNRSGGFGSTGR